MPLIRIEAAAGRSQEEIKALLDAAHRAVLSAFKVPERDRYQIYQEPSAESRSNGSDFPMETSLRLRRYLPVRSSEAL